MKRIVKRTHANGEVDYAVETNRLFGFIPCGWHTVSVTAYINFEHMTCDAVFSTYELARFYGGFTDKDKKIVKEEVMEEM